MSIKYLPVSLTLANKHCLVVGGGEVALRKIDTLLEYETSITVVTPEAVEKISYYAAKKNLSLKLREYNSPEAEQYDLVIAASDSQEVNRKVYEDAKKGKTPINVVDTPELCDFIFPAVLRRDLLTIAISTDGNAPFLGRRLKTILDSIFPSHWSRIARLAARFRNKVRVRWAGDSVKKAECYQKFLESDWKDLISRMTDAEIEAELDRLTEA
jgi:siroheme synthase-like protein